MKKLLVVLLLGVLVFAATPARADSDPIFAYGQRSGEWVQMAANEWKPVFFDTVLTHGIATVGVGDGTGVWAIGFVVPAFTEVRVLGSVECWNSVSSTCEVALFPDPQQGGFPYITAGSATRAAGGFAVPLDVVLYETNQEVTWTVWVGGDGGTHWYRVVNVMIYGD